MSSTDFEWRFITHNKCTERGGDWLSVHRHFKSRIYVQYSDIVPAMYQNCVSQITVHTILMTRTR